MMSNPNKPPLPLSDARFVPYYNPNDTMPAMLSKRAREPSGDVIEISTVKPRRSTRRKCATTVTSQKKPAALFHEALKQMKAENLSIDKVDKHRRIEIYQSHSLNRFQWNSIYKSYITKFPKKALPTLSYSNFAKSFNVEASSSMSSIMGSGAAPEAARNDIATNAGGLSKDNIASTNDADNAANVLARKARGSEILKTGKSFSELNIEQLKDVLPVCEIYPKRMPPTPYAKGRSGLLKQLLNSFTCDIDKMPLGAVSALSEGGVEIASDDACVSSSSQ